MLTTLPLVFISWNRPDWVDFSLPIAGLYLRRMMKLNEMLLNPAVIAHMVAVDRKSAQKPGKGGAFAQIELRGIRDGTKLNERFRSSETVERVILDETECTFLYDDGDHLVFMHSETFEQISIKKDMVGERATFLQDGMIVTMSSHEGDPICELPDTVVMEVVEADAVVKGQTASSSYTACCFGKWRACYGAPTY